MQLLCKLLGHRWLNSSVRVIGPTGWLHSAAPRDARAYGDTGMRRLCTRCGRRERYISYAVGIGPIRFWERVDAPHSVKSG